MSGNPSEVEIELLGLTTVSHNLSHNNSCVGGSCNESVASPMYEFERLVSIIVPTLFGVIFLLGLIGNLMVILVVVLQKHMRNTTNVIILSLAVADLFFIVFCVPSTATTYAYPVWPFGNTWCKVVQYIIYVSVYASVYMLVLMSLDRCLAVVNTFTSVRFRSERNAWLAVGITWGVILLANVPVLLQYGEFIYEHKQENRSACLNIADLYDPSIGKRFFACFLTFGYVIPLGIVCLIYGFMLTQLYKMVPGGKQSAEGIRSMKRVTRMIIIVVVTFALCWLPNQIILVVQNFGNYPQEMSYVGLQMAANCLAYMNSCMNPFLYAFLSENFRRSFKKMPCCFLKPGLNGDQATGTETDRHVTNTSHV